MRKRIGKLLLLTVTVTATLTAQDIHFSQFTMAPLLQNPALSGADHDMRASINYKDQWRSVASPYKTFSASFDMKLNRKAATNGFWALGTSFFADKAGDARMGTTQGNLDIAYHVLLNEKSTLGLGMMGGFCQRSLSYSQLQWMNQYDGISYSASLPSGEPEGATHITYADLGAGLAWTYKKGEAYIKGNDQVQISTGVAIFHPHQPEYSFYNSGERLKMKTLAHGTILYGIKNTQLSLVPGFMFSAQGSSNELIVGSLFRITTKESSKYTGYVKGSAFSLGLHYRHRDAIIASALIEMGQYTLGLSYDINVSGLKTASTGRGGVEISLRFVNPNPFYFQSRSRF